MKEYSERRRLQCACVPFSPVNQGVERLPVIRRRNVQATAHSVMQRVKGTSRPSRLHTRITARARFGTLGVEGLATLEVHVKLIVRSAFVVVTGLGIALVSACSGKTEPAAAPVAEADF